MRVVCHQHRIRTMMADLHPEDGVVPLESCRVVRISRAEAESIILPHEWLGTMPPGIRACYGLVGEGILLGAACFGQGSGPRSRFLCGPEWADRVITLSRGACTHRAHHHAGSFLVSRAVKLVAEDLGARVVTAYSDPDAGEVGTIYQACNWLYIGFGTGKEDAGYGRWDSRMVGEQDWMSSRARRSWLKARGWADTAIWWKLARVHPSWEFRQSSRKARYVTFCGPRKEARAARAALLFPVLPYPRR